MSIYGHVKQKINNNNLLATCTRLPSNTDNYFSQRIDYRKIVDENN